LKLHISSSPHIKSEQTVSTIMRDVVIALIPAGLVAIYYFGLRALAVIITCVVSAVISEIAANKLFGIPVTISDWSAIVTGMLLAYCLPPTIPLWIAALGSVFAIVIGKSVFGGLGKNIFNPAHVGRAFLLASWPAVMTTWMRPVSFMSRSWFKLSSVDVTTMATPLGILKEGSISSGIEFLKYFKSHYGLSLWDMVTGNTGGCIGETSAIALLIGAIYLFSKKHITWHIPAPFILTVAILSFFFGGKSFFDPYMMLIYLFSGGLFIGAFFMATDMVTSPTTPAGRVIFGFGCGLLVFLIRKFSASFPEGVCYSILIMNAFVPLIDKFTVPKKFGEVK